MTREEEEMFQNMLKMVNSSNDYHNFDSTQEFDTTENYDDGESVLNMEYGQRHRGTTDMDRGQSTFELQVFYTAVVGVADVTVQLFRSYFNPGVFVGDDLVFTNAAADTGTVRGITAIYRALQLRAETQPFKIHFVRLEPVATAQLGERWTFLKSSVWGGNKDNNLTPRTFITPEQFQLGRVDVPINMIADGERGIQFDLNPSETLVLGGFQITLFIDKIMDPTRKLQGKSEVLSLKSPRGIVDPAPAESLQRQVAEVAKMLRLKS